MPDFLLQLVDPMVFVPLVVCVAALLMDAVFGEPRFHPLVAFGKLSMWIEKGFNRPKNAKTAGFMCVALLAFLPSALLWMLLYWIDNIWIESGIAILVLWIAVGWRSMKDHARAVSRPLLDNDIQTARKNLSMIVSRETGDMETPAIVGSTIESLFENGNDCLFGSLFWFAVLGPAGVVLHRLSNTLDAMWGYKSERYRQFGYAAARLDDLLGWLPARLTGFCYALSGSFLNAIKSWKAQSGKHKSINGGLVMASGAGALKIRIGGPVVYDGVLEDKPWLGSGKAPDPDDIEKAVRLIHRSIGIWLCGYAFDIILLTSQYP